MSIPIVVYYLTVTELNTMALLHMQNYFSGSSGLEVMSHMFCLLTVFYIYGFLAWMIYKLSFCNKHKSPLTKDQFKVYTIMLNWDSVWSRNIFNAMIVRKLIGSYILVFVNDDPKS